MSACNTRDSERCLSDSSSPLECMWQTIEETWLLIYKGGDDIFIVQNFHKFGKIPCIHLTFIYLILAFLTWRFMWPFIHFTHQLDNKRGCWNSNRGIKILYSNGWGIRTVYRSNGWDTGLTYGRFRTCV